MHGNPWLRLLRREVEALIKNKHGDAFLKGQQAKTEMARINREIKQLKARVAALEARTASLASELGK